MSRSKRTPVLKDHGWRHHKYNRIIRRCLKHDLRNNLQLKDYDEILLKLSREIINDYDICDYAFYPTIRPYKCYTFDVQKLTRK